MKPSSPTKEGRESASFRDNFGYLFWSEGQVYRRVNQAGIASYVRLMESGLYKELSELGSLITHEELAKSGDTKDIVTIKPTLLKAISYPYEWSFSALKDAALLTLAVEQAALKKGMTLRDASAYNVQFVNGDPCLIDTLSLGIYVPGQPWEAYRQFCQHFLAPLALMSKVDLGLQQLLRVHIDGIPLALAARLIPPAKHLNLGLLTHLSLHARFQRNHESAERKPAGEMNLTSLLGLLDSLERTVRALKLPETKTQWGEYYDNTNYSEESFREKGEIVRSFLRQVKPERVLDIGSNDGVFSRIAAEEGAYVLSCDIDPMAVEHNYLRTRARKESRLLPMLIDLTNPSPALGWAQRERQSFTERARGEVTLALALVHHLAIGNNLPLDIIAEYFTTLSPFLIIEFVPKSDSQVIRLLASREDIFDDYTMDGFLMAFRKYYDLIGQQAVKGTERNIYIMKRLVS